MLKNDTLAGKKVFIWGCGIDAVKCVYSLNNSSTTFEGFVVTELKNNCEQFIGKTVFEVSNVIGKDSFFVVAVSYNSYMAIAEKLREFGKREFLDFIYYKYLNKRLVYLHGNCHCDVISAYLLSCAKFDEKFTLYHAPRLTSGVKLRVEQEIFDNIDVWIHQDIRDDNMIGYEASDSYIRGLLPKDNKVKEITIPNLYGLGYAFFPQNRKSKNNKRNSCIQNRQGVDLNGMFCISDVVLDQIIDEEGDVSNQQIGGGDRKVLWRCL